MKLHLYFEMVQCIKTFVNVFALSVFCFRSLLCKLWQPISLYPIWKAIFNMKRSRISGFLFRNIIFLSLCDFWSLLLLLLLVLVAAIISLISIIIAITFQIYGKLNCDWANRFVNFIVCLRWVNKFCYR